MLGMINNGENGEERISLCFGGTG